MIKKREKDVSNRLILMGVTPLKLSKLTKPAADLDFPNIDY